jgi:hypothetical protein
MVEPAPPVRAAAARVCRGVGFLLALLCATPVAAARKEASPPPLPSEHRHPSGAFTIRTPEGWRVEPAPDDPDVLVASGDRIVLRFVYRDGEVGLDSLHSSCMTERLTPLMDVQPNVEYEYDFVGGVILENRALDSAFVVRYDRPVQGEKVWRQRNVTVVGGGRSLCVVTHAPLSDWKKKADTRRLADAVMGSLAFH